MTEINYVPVNHFTLHDDDKARLFDAVNTNWISSAGKYVDEFENNWAQKCGVKHGIGVSNGTTALEVVVEAIGIEKGDEVILPTYTIVSCAQAVTRVGAIPVLVDCDPLTWCMDVAQIEARITPRTKAIMVVHIFGHPVDMDPIMALADKYGLVVIEDAAEVHGAKYLSGRDTENPEWKYCGGIGHIATFSFFANKLITTGEGGMVITNVDRYAEKARALRNLCFRADRRFLHTELGHQFRLTNMQAALGVGQVDRIDAIVDRKREIAQAYSERFVGLHDIVQLPHEESWAHNVYWVYAMVLADHVPFDATEFAARLRAKGVDTRLFFWCMHEQPVFHDMGLFKGETYPVSERIARRGLYIPSGTALSQNEISFVADQVISVLKEAT